MDLELSHEDFTRAVDRTVNELLESAHIDRPPVDAVALAAHLRLTLDLDPDFSAHQRQAAAAHAIGEHLRPELLQRLGIDPNARRALMSESLPRLFTERLLIPSIWFKEDAADGDLFALTKRYSTASPEMIAFRFLDLPEPCVVSVVEDDQVWRRKSNGVRVRKKLEPPEVECVRLVSRHSEAQVVRRGGWTVQGWPISSGGRLRVLLRSVVDEETGG